MAERGIRQLAVLRKISGSFFKQSASNYLRLLAISQTCRFQGKSFLKILLSEETDLDSFRQSRPVRYSYAVCGHEAMPEPPRNPYRASIDDWQKAEIARSRRV